MASVLSLTRKTPNLSLEYLGGGTKADVDGMNALAIAGDKERWLDALPWVGVGGREVPEEVVDHEFTPVCLVQHFLGRTNIHKSLKRFTEGDDSFPGAMVSTSGPILVEAFQKAGVEVEPPETTKPWFLKNKIHLIDRVVLRHFLEEVMQTRPSSRTSAPFKKRPVQEIEEPPSAKKPRLCVQAALQAADRVAVLYQPLAYLCEVATVTWSPQEINAFVGEIFTTRMTKLMPPAPPVVCLPTSRRLVNLLRQALLKVPAFCLGQLSQRVQVTDQEWEDLLRCVWDLEDVIPIPSVGQSGYPEAKEMEDIEASHSADLSLALCGLARVYLPEPQRSQILARGEGYGIELEPLNSGLVSLEEDEVGLEDEPRQREVDSKCARQWSQWINEWFDEFEE